MATIGEKLKTLRKNKKLTQEQVAPLVGLSRSTLSNYEINRRTPHLKELERLARFYGVGMEYFTVSVQNEAFDLLTRAKDVFESDNVPRETKDEIYMELMKLYLILKEENSNDNRLQ